VGERVQRVFEGASEGVGSDMDIGIFQLLPQPEGLSDRDVIAQAQWEVDLAEAGGYSSVWVTEHHLSPFGLVGAPSVYAAAIAARTERISIGYGVAVVPLHHPLRLAEEIAWIDYLSRGRVVVGVGPGFSPYEFAAFGVPLGERHRRLEEGLAILRGALGQSSFVHSGEYWTFPRIALRPRPYHGAAPPFLRACSSLESVRQAAHEGTPLMLGLKSNLDIAERIAAYRAVRCELGLSAAEIDREVAAFRVLRRVSVADTDEEAVAAMKQALIWEGETAQRVHGPAAPGAGATTADGGAVRDGGGVPGACAGTPATVAAELLSLRSLGIQHVIAWLNFGDMPYAKVRQSMELIAQEIIPLIAEYEQEGSGGVKAALG
jgi:alkanesulfonate monooxygenase SsuD/methylene tetrahydromethanopterin reductase-like flavin-dependent oxidoreductase (luciferase family)